MTAFLSDAWLDALSTAVATGPAYAGPAFTVEVAVTGAPGGKVTYHVVLADGASPQWRAGAFAEADVHVDMRYDDAAAEVRGEFDPVVGFMSGHMKVKGSSRPLLELWHHLALDPVHDALASVYAGAET